MHDEIEYAAQEPEHNAVKLTACRTGQDNCRKRGEQGKDDGQESCNEHKVLEEVSHNPNYNRVDMMPEHSAILAGMNISNPNVSNLIFRRAIIDKITATRAGMTILILVIGPIFTGIFKQGIES